MPSLTAPQGNITPPRTDVKPSAPSSEAEVEAAPKRVDPQESPKETAPQSKQDPDVDESDLAAVEENKKVPYQRFKEKVDETKSLKQRIEAMERQSQLAIQRANEDAELRVRAKLQQERESAQVEELDPVERKIHSQNSELAQVKAELAEIKTQNSRNATQSLITKLQQKYPEADDLAVLGWAQARGIKHTDEDAFEELMAASHNRNVDRDAQGIRKILEQKKARAKTAIPTREGGIRLKDGEKPKSVKEAAALTRRYIESGGQ